MMGLRSTLHWAAWFTRTLAMITISTLFITCLLCFRWANSAAILDNSDHLVIFCVLFTYGISMISFSFMVSVFFSKANAAATAAGLLWFTTHVPYFFIAARYNLVSWNNKMFMSFASNTALAIGSRLIVMHEGTGEGLHWSNINRPITPGDDFTIAWVLFMLIFDSCLYLLIMVYVETVFPGEYGVPLPWYFPFKKSYWSGHYMLEDGQKMLQEPSVLADPEYFEEDPVGLFPGIQIRNLCKIYSQQNVAVKPMNMNMYENQITVLLGHNGAGKTTTMSMLTGLFPPTFGTAYISRHNIRDNMAAVRQSLGLCPQHDVLFNGLTVEEHLIFFAKLKGAPSHEVKPEIDHLLRSLQLEDKRNSTSETLSGGMKRKLSVAIALIGGSKVVLLDEPTSGMDPAARRTTWDVLQQERFGRTILLTTHFMDEADLLGDRIGIMAHGELQCCGAPLFLKKKYGAGYHLTIVKQPHCDVDRITELVLSFLPTAELESRVGAEIAYILPREGVSKFEELFTVLEGDKDFLGIASFGASVTTMEEVFLRVGMGQGPDVNLKTILTNAKATMGSKNSSVVDFRDQDYLLSTDNCIIDGPHICNPKIVTKLNDGLDLYYQQFWATLVKRVLHTRRNWKLSLTQMVIPLVFLWYSLLLVNTMPTNNNPKSLTLDLAPFGETEVPVTITNNASKELLSLSKMYKYMFDISDHIVDIGQFPSHTTFKDYLLKKMTNNFPHFNRHCIVGASFRHSPNSNTLMLIAHFNNQPYHTPPLTLALADTAVLRYMTGNANIKLNVINHPFPPTVLSSQQETTGESFVVTYHLVFGIAILASSFIIFLIKERITKARHLQFVSGVNCFIFWATTFIWDFINYFIPCLAILVSLALFEQKGYTEMEMHKRYILIFLLYGWSMLPLTYCLSFLFKTSSGGFTQIAIFYILSSSSTFWIVTMLYVPTMELLDWAKFYDWLFTLFPNYNLAWAFSELQKNNQILKICSNELIKPFCELSKVSDDCGDFTCPKFQENYLSWDSPGVGRMVTVLTLQGFIFWGILFGIETHFFRKFKNFLKFHFARIFRAHSTKDYFRLPQDLPRNKFRQNADTIRDNYNEDDDVAFERERVSNVPLSCLLTTDNLILRNITKYYKNFLAVDHISAGIPRGECFGLLGINGAGKTTTFKMLTGDELISHGDAFVDGYSVMHHIQQVRKRIGYCPQFDAVIDQMTGRETLRMFARLRGVQEKHISKMIDQLGDDLLFSDDIDKLAKDYSGGNRRKLSTAVALVGGPPIILLDEPTTGMDPLARRLLWDSISRVRDQGHSIILTSHSMEECDVLCTRLAIMVNGQFRCVGSPQHLKSKFGKGYTLIAKVRSPTIFVKGQYNIKDITRRLCIFIESTFPGSIIKDTHQGMIHCHIQNPKLTWATIFGTMERAKDEYNIEDYSVSQTTLEQIFLNFAGAQRSNEAT